MQVDIKYVQNNIKIGKKKKRDGNERAVNRSDKASGDELVQN